MAESSGGASADKSRHLAEVALRLRRIEAARAHQSPADFSARVTAEVRRALAEVAPDGHIAFLEEVQAKFPDLDLGIAPQAPADSGNGQAATLDPDSEVGALVERLIGILPELSDEERDAAADQLAAAGFIPQDNATWRPDVHNALVGGLALKNDEVPDPNRVAELALLMTEFSTTIQQLTWTTWKTIAPHAAIRRGGLTQKSLARFVAGQPDMTREAVAADLTALRHMIASIISGISDVGHQFAASHLARFMPAEIESAVDAEGGGGMFKNKAALCWKKYGELSESLDPTAIETEIRRVIAEHAEHLLKALGN